jgi:isopenicillin-N epimerase
MGHMPDPSITLFDLDPAYAHLNHGGFGTSPRAVRETQERWRVESDRNPHRFNRVDVLAEIAASRAAGACFLGVDSDEVALVRNVSEGVSTVLSALKLSARDEIVLGNHGYGSVRIAVERLCARTGARLVDVTFGLDAGAETIADAFAARVGKRTRLVIVDQITSATAWHLPVAAIAEAVRSVRSDTVILVDAAHVPGQVDIHLPGLGVDIWVGNFHKWAFAPRGTAAMWVAPRWRRRVEPLVVSWRAGEPFPANFDRTGTLDHSGWLALPAALEFWRAIGGWEQVGRNSHLVTMGQRLVADRLGTSLEGLPATPAPAMRLVRLPESTLSDSHDAEKLTRRLSTDWMVEVAPIWFEGEGYIRLAAQIYNDPIDYERLADALVAIRDAGAIQRGRR